MMKKWGRAKTAIAVLWPEVEQRLSNGETAASIYDALVAEGRAEHFKRTAFFHWVRRKDRPSIITSHHQTNRPKGSVVSPLPPHPLLPPKGSILPASPVSPGEGNGNALMLGEDGTD